MNIFQTLFYQPLLNALVLVYQFLPGGLGAAIIVLTIIIKAALYPLNQKALKSQKIVAELEPQLKEIRKRSKGSQEQIARETMALYSQAKINPLSSLFLLFLQLPILIALYQVFSQFTASQDLVGLYPFVAHPGQIDAFFFGLNLAAPNTILALVSAVLFFLQMKFSQVKTNSKQQAGQGSEIMMAMQKQTAYFFPVLSFLILLRVASAVALYLSVSSILSLVEIKFLKKNKEDV